MDYCLSISARLSISVQFIKHRPHECSSFPVFLSLARSCNLRLLCNTSLSPSPAVSFGFLSAICFLHNEMLSAYRNLKVLHSQISDRRCRAELHVRLEVNAWLSLSIHESLTNQTFLPGKVEVISEAFAVICTNISFPDDLWLTLSLCVARKLTGHELCKAVS